MIIKYCTAYHKSIQGMNCCVVFKYALLGQFMSLSQKKLYKVFHTINPSTLLHLIILVFKQKDKLRPPSHHITQKKLRNSQQYFNWRINYAAVASPKNLKKGWVVVDNPTMTRNTTFLSNPAFSNSTITQVSWF